MTLPTSVDPQNSTEFVDVTNAGPIREILELPKYPNIMTLPIPVDRTVLCLLTPLMLDQSERLRKSE